MIKPSDLPNNFLKERSTSFWRFLIWTKTTFEKLDSIYGSFDKLYEKKKGYVLPRAKMMNCDLTRIVNSLLDRLRRR